MRITVYKDRHNLLNKNIAVRSIDEGEPLPKGCYYTEEEALQVIKKRESTAKASYLEGKALSQPLLAKFKEEYSELLEQQRREKETLLKYHSCVVVERDTETNYDDCCGCCPDSEEVIAMKVNGYYYYLD